MVSGFDSVFLTRDPVRPHLQGFLDSWAGIWPNMRVSAAGRDDDDFGPWSRVRDDVTNGAGEILVARDPAMETGWDDTGYALNDDGEGPFAIFYSAMPGDTTRVRALEDPYRHGAGFRFEPYDLVILGAGYTLVTLVTPDADSPFSRRVLDTFAAAFAG